VNLHPFTGWIRETLVEMDPFLADFQEDFDVDGGDLKFWQGSFGASFAATHTQGDADGDVDVDGADFLIWQRQLQSVAAFASSTAMPEPSSASLAVVVTFGIQIFGRRWTRVQMVAKSSC
jgi:hypothetical protein